MKVHVLDLKGKSKGEIELPPMFKTDFRPDIIKRTFLAVQSQKRQPYGSDPMAGKRTSVHYHGKRRVRFTMINIDRARLPRLHATSPHLMYRVRRVPQAVKGRRAHPPKAEKKWEQKINKKEELLALMSAIAATSNKEIVKNRGHVIDGIKELPIVVDDKIQSLSKTKEVKEALKSLGMEKELERSKQKKVRAGRGKLRGRKYKRKIGPLIVVNEDKGILKAGSNIPGVDVRNIKKITVEDLAPGASAGRLTIFSKSAIETLRGL